MAVRSLLFIVAALLVLAGTAFGASPSGDLRLALILPKSVFEVGEKIDYQLKITNVSGRGVSLRNTSMPFVGHRIEVIDADGKPVPFIPGLSGFFHQFYAITMLPSGESTTCNHPLNDYAVIDKPGRYTAVAHMRPDTAIGQSLSVAPDSVSDPVAFTVVPSTEQSRNERYDAALEAIGKAKEQYGRQQAVYDLCYTRDRRAVPELLRLYRASDVGYAVLTSLFTFGDEAREAMLDDLRKNGMIPYHTGDLMTAFHISKQEMAGIAEVWLHSTDAVQRANGVLSVPAIGADAFNGPTKQYVHGLLHDPEPKVRKAAVQSTWDPAYGVKREEILNLAEADPSDGVRVDAAFALERFEGGKEQALQVLKTLLYDPSKKGRANDYAFYIRTLRTPSAKALLQEGARSADPDFRAACNKQLQEWQQ